MLSRVQRAETCHRHRARDRRLAREQSPAIPTGCWPTPVRRRPSRHRSPTPGCRSAPSPATTIRCIRTQTRHGGRSDDSRERAARGAARRPGRCDVLRMPRRSRGRGSSELGHLSVAAGVLRYSRMAVDDEGDSLLAQTAKFAADHGVKLALEPHPGFLVYNVETALRLRDVGGSESRRELRSQSLLLAGR